MSQSWEHFLAGCQRFMPEVLAMVAPTVNSYSRMVPGAWAPTNATWGVENRTTALRVIPGSASSQRIEYRVVAADTNPYLALAAVLGSGLAGIEQKLTATDAIQGNAYEQQTPQELDLPQTLTEAAGRLRASTMANEWFGGSFVSHFAASRVGRTSIPSRGHRLGIKTIL